MKYTVLIVDDEPNAREYLKDLVAEQSSLALCGICNSGNEAIRFCKSLQPDIVFLDIQMPGLNGIESAKLLMEAQLTSVIIFTTAYDQYAIEAFEVAAMGYLLKPFSSDQFSNQVQRVQHLLETKKKATFGTRMQKLFESYSKGSNEKLQEIIISEKGLELRIQVKDILYIESDSEYAMIHIKERKYIKRLSLTLLSDQLPANFIRIHRSIIINKDQVKSWKYLNNSTFQFSFANEESVKSSRAFKDDIDHALSS